tara:strand:- start:2061 stop:2303 length:243 start_codon:yes stop_codon:yes gene_type:complete
MMINGEVLAELETLARHFEIQVLVTEDLETIDTEVAPWLHNIIVDERGRFAIPEVISEDEGWNDLWECEVMTDIREELCE